MPEELTMPKVKKELSGLRLFRAISRDPLKFFYDLSLKEKAYAWLRLGRHRVLFLNDATAISQIFRKDKNVYHKGIYNEGIRPLLGNSIFMSEGNLWWKQRKDLAPAFASGNFEEYVRQINSAVDAMTERWRSDTDPEQKIDISREMMLLTLDVVFRTMFHQGNCELQREISNGIHTMLSLAESRIWAPFSLPMKLVLKRGKYQKTLKFLDQITSGLAEARRNNQDYPTDLLALLLESHGNTVEQKRLLRDNIISFVVAGHETTANAVSWAFFELGRNRAAKDRLIKEVSSVNERDLTFVKAKSMSYSNAVLNEAMRLYPPVWTMSRECLQNDTLDFEDGTRLHVPADTTVMLCAYTVHRREKYWEDPEAFYPERFLGSGTPHSNKAWFPFGGGARLCLGFRLAEMEAACIFHKVFSQFDLALVPNQNISPQPIITLRPDRPIWFRVKPRKAKNVLLADTLGVIHETTRKECPHNVAA